MKRFMIGALLLGLGCVLGLSGCGGSDPVAASGGTAGSAATSAAGGAPSASSGSNPDGSDLAGSNPSGSNPAGAAPSSGVSAGSAPKGSPGAAAGGSGAGSAGTTANGQPSAGIPKEVCRFLKREAPLLKATGSKQGALARFAVDYAGFIAEDPNRKLANAAELDKLTTSTCPKIRAQALKALKGKSFVALLGG